MPDCPLKLRTFWLLDLPVTFSKALSCAMFVSLPFLPPRAKTHLWMASSPFPCFPAERRHFLGTRWCFAFVFWFSSSSDHPEGRLSRYRLGPRLFQFLFFPFVIGYSILLFGVFSSWHLTSLLAVHSISPLTVPPLVFNASFRELRGASRECYPLLRLTCRCVNFESSVWRLPGDPLPVFLP